MFSKHKNHDSPKTDEQAQQQKQQPKKSGLLSPNQASTTGNKTEMTAGKVGKSHHQFFKVMNQHKAVSKTGPITLSQLNQHKTIQSAWLSLNGTIYDVTVYMNYHPGGKILLDGCGKQCDSLFNAHHPWVNATYLLQKYKIGHLSK